MNVVVLVGNLTRDPELKYTPNGTAKCQFSVAVNRVWTNASGERQQDVDFVPIVVWGAQGENCSKYLAKGRKVAVQGRINVQRYEVDGISRIFTCVVANRVQFLTPKAEAEGTEESENGAVIEAETNGPPF